MPTQTSITAQVQQFFAQHPMDRPVLLAISGGLDSVVLLHVLVSCKILVALAHVNFKLRGEESNEDELFIRQLAKQYQLKLHTLRRKDSSHKPKANIQSWARKVRYAWFKRLLQQHQYGYLITAHHANDNAETLLLNLGRGAGLTGLKAMLPASGNTLRPLLAVSRDEILAYAQQNKLAWREDSSNATLHYRRNQVRHLLMPVMQQVFPVVQRNHLRSSINILQSEHALLQEYLGLLAQRITHQEGKVTFIHLPSLLALSQPALVLFKWLAAKGFSHSQCQQVLDSSTQPPAFFQSKKWTLSKEHEYIILLPSVYCQPVNAAFTLEETITVGLWQFKASLRQVREDNLIQPPFHTWLPEDFATQPLYLSSWQAGDKLQAFGTKGQKLVAAILSDAKEPHFIRTNHPVLCTAGGSILWLPGQRAAAATAVQPGQMAYLLQAQHAFWPFSQHLKQKFAAS